MNTILMSQSGMLEMAEWLLNLDINFMPSSSTFRMALWPASNFANSALNSNALAIKNRAKNLSRAPAKKVSKVFLTIYFLLSGLNKTKFPEAAAARQCPSANCNYSTTSKKGAMKVHWFRYHSKKEGKYIDAKRATQDTNISVRNVTKNSQPKEPYISTEVTDVLKIQTAHQNEDGKEE